MYIINVLFNGMLFLLFAFIQSSCLQFSHHNTSNMKFSSFLTDTIKETSYSIISFPSTKHTHTHTLIYSYICVNSLTHSYTYTYAYIHTQTQSYTHICVRSYIQTHICTHLYTHLNSHSYTYIHAFMLTHSRTPPALSPPHPGTPRQLSEFQSFLCNCLCSSSRKICSVKQNNQLPSYSKKAVYFSQR